MNLEITYAAFMILQTRCCPVKNIKSTLAQIHEM